MPDEDDKVTDPNEGESDPNGEPTESKPSEVDTSTMTKEELEAHYKAQVAGLNTALHKERAQKGEKKTLTAQLDETNKKIDRIQKEKQMMAYVQEDELIDSALAYYEKLSQGITDPEELKKIMNRSASMARADRGGDTPDPIRNAAASMHSGGRPGAPTSDVSPQAIELGRHFGVSAEKLKEVGTRRIKNLYNQ